MGANAIFNLLRREDVLLLTEGLSALEVTIPPSLAGRTIAESDIRHLTGCNVVALEAGDEMTVNPPPGTRLPLGARMFLVGTADAEERFLQRFMQRG